MVQRVSQKPSYTRLARRSGSTQTRVQPERASSRAPRGNYKTIAPEQSVPGTSLH